VKHERLVLFYVTLEVFELPSTITFGVVFEIFIEVDLGDIYWNPYFSENFKKESSN